MININDIIIINNTILNLLLTNCKKKRFMYVLMNFFQQFKIINYKRPLPLITVIIILLI